MLRPLLPAFYQPLAAKVLAARLEAGWIFSGEPALPARNDLREVGMEGPPVQQPTIECKIILQNWGRNKGFLKQKLRQSAANRFALQKMI